MSTLCVKQHLGQLIEEIIAEYLKASFMQTKH